MIVVVDSNIIFSALLSKNSFFLETLLKEEYRFVSPNFLFTEIFKHKEKLLKHPKLTEAELLELLNNLLSTMQFIPYNFISAQSVKKAIELYTGVDMRGVVFVGLSIEVGEVLWTGDKTLKDGITAKGFNQFFSPKKLE
ncbi:MAG TPA: PIN domain-containing protein [Panacibacter sp.]|nr:PIN domain-containing protein [Panacibacter sp.]